MKFSIFGILLIIFFTGCEVTIDTGKSFNLKLLNSNEENVLVYKKPNGLFCKIGTNTPFTGIGIHKDLFFYENLRGNEHVFLIKNGIREGNFYSLDTKSRVVLEGEFKNDKLNGLVHIYMYENDLFLLTAVHKIIEYDNGKPLNLKFYNNNKILFAELTLYENEHQYKDGWLISSDAGYIKQTFKNGKVILTEPYDANKLH